MKIYTRVLICGMADSIHVARWLELFIDEPIEFRLVSSSPHRRVHPRILEMLENPNPGGMSVTMGEVSKKYSLPLWLLDRPFLFNNKLRSRLLRREIKDFSPNYLHLMETQNAGYLALTALRGAAEPGFKVALTLFGSDLFWYGRFSRHAAKIRALLPRTDVLLSECSRDISAAQELGFNGEHFPLMPVAGGIGEVEITSTEQVFSHRKLILVKGYGGKWGLGKNVLLELNKCASQLKGFQVVVISSSLLVKLLSRFLQAFGAINVVSFGKGALTHHEVLSLLRNSRAYIGASRSDGLPATFVEALSQGAFPIQTDTSCASEWVVDGETGFLLNPQNLSPLSTWLERIITDDEFFRFAQMANLHTARKRLRRESLARSAQALYKGSI